MNSLRPLSSRLPVYVGFCLFRALTAPNDNAASKTVPQIPRNTQLRSRVSVSRLFSDAQSVEFNAPQTLLFVSPASLCPYGSFDPAIALVATCAWKLPLAGIATTSGCTSRVRQLTLPGNPPYEYFPAGQGAHNALPYRGANVFSAHGIHAVESVPAPIDHRPG